VTGNRFTLPQSPELQRIGNHLDAEMIFARSDFVNVFDLTHFRCLREADLSHMYVQWEVDLFHG